MRSIFFVVVLWLTTLAHAATPPSEIVVTPGNEFQLFGEKVEVYSDHTGEMTLEQVIAHAPFERNTTMVPNLGIGHAVHWIRFRVHNRTKEHSLGLSIGNAEIEYIDLWGITGGDTLHHFFGQAVPIADLSGRDVEPLVPLPIAEGDFMDVYLRLKSDKQLVVPLGIGGTEATRIYSTRRDLIIGTYLGFMLALLLYNLFLYISTRDRYYFIYVVYICLVTVTQAVFLGVAKVYLWPNNVWLATQASVIFTVITAVAANEFMCAFIRVNAREPRLARWRFAIYALMGVAMAARLTVVPIEGYQVLQMVVMTSAAYQFVVAFRIARRGSRVARYFLGAWCMFLMGIILFVLKDMGLIHYNNFTKYTMTLGTAFEGIVLSIALADRINVLRREKEQSQALALAAARENERIIREQNTLLELKVKERTRDLEQSNEHLKRTQTQLVSAEKMASLGQLTAGIAHEINNPINFITSNIRPLKRNIADLLTVVDLYRKVEPANASQGLQAVRAEAEEMGLDETITELDEIIDCIAEGSSRTAEIVRGLRNFSRLDEDALKDADLNEGLRSTLALMVPQYRDRVEFDVQLDELPRVECYPGRLNQVFMNILTNGVQAAMAKEGDAMPTIQVRTRTLGDHVEVVIADNGIGMTDEVKARIFDPFYTTKDVGEGTGLGLAIAYGIIEDHHATIAVDSTPGQGTAFRITIPVRHQRTLEKRA